MSDLEYIKIKMMDSPQRRTLLVLISLAFQMCLFESIATSEDSLSQSHRLWETSKQVPKTSELSPLQGVKFLVIKAHEPDQDGGYGFLHGVALCWHKGKLYASWGHNKGLENTASEEARGRVSSDGGKTWGMTFTIDAGSEKNLAVSHGVFHSDGEKLWAFMGAFYGKRQDVHTRAYVLNEETGSWEFQGRVIGDGFWPMEEPTRMSNGNWIIGGLKVGDGNPAAVAISRGNDLTQWDVKAIPKPTSIQKMWGESTTLVRGQQILNISRWGEQPFALLARSEDFGQTWTPSVPSNLPMATSKPYTGRLSTGENYLICTTTSDSRHRRSPLTIALSNPSEDQFSRILKIRDAEFPSGPGESHPQAKLSYPYAIEHDGKLYVGYSNNGGRSGMNINSAELAILPVAELRK